MKAAARDALLHTLEQRFAQNPARHPGVVWADVVVRMRASAAHLRVLAEMEATGGEPDVVGSADEHGAFLICDCSAESPLGRRSLCYDGAALQSRKQNKPDGDAASLAAAIGVALLTEAQYRQLQQVGEFDLKTSSWVATPPEIRQLGGALFGDRRYGQVFVYHNGAESYYAVRGFRGALRV